MEPPLLFVGVKVTVETAFRGLILTPAAPELRVTEAGSVS